MYPESHSAADWIPAEVVTGRQVVFQSMVLLWARHVLTLLE